MGQIHEAIADALETEVQARTGWDEPPGLYFLYLERGKPRLSLLDFPDQMWELARPPEILARFAASTDLFRAELRTMVPEGLFGIAFRCEGWEIQQTPEVSEADWEQARADALAHRIHARPDRVEIRFMQAVDRAGTTYWVSVIRGQAGVRRFITYHGPERFDAMGASVDALDRILSGLLGVTLPKRPDEDESWAEFRARKGGRP